MSVRNAIPPSVLCFALLLAACSSDESATTPPSGQAADSTGGPAAQEQPAEPALAPLPEAEQPAEALAEQPAGDADGDSADGAGETAAGATGAAAPEEHRVRAVVTQWDPMVVFAEPGDSVRFVNMAGHDTQAIEGMFPEGAGGWRSKMGEEGFSVTLDVPGVYIYKCNPHITTGMVGAVVVGEPEAGALDGLEAAADDVPVGGNMVRRTVRKLRKAMQQRGQGA